MQQELPDIRLELGHDLLDEIVGDELVAAHEGADERVDVPFPVERDGGHLQTCCPSLGSVDEHLDLRGGEVAPGHVVDKCPGLGGVERELVGAHLDQAPVEAEAVEVDRRIPAGPEDDPHVAR